MKFKFDKTKRLMKDMYDGLLMYIFWYLATAGLLWFGFWLLELYPVGYWQCFGGIFAIRQIRALIMRKGQDWKRKGLKKPYRAIKRKEPVGGPGRVIQLFDKSDNKLIASKIHAPEEDIEFDYEGIRYYSPRSDWEIYYLHLTPEQKRSY